MTSTRKILIGVLVVTIVFAIDASVVIPKYFEQQDMKEKLENAALLIAHLNAEVRGKREMNDSLTYQLRTCDDNNAEMQTALTNIQEEYYDHTKAPEERMTRIFELTWQDLNHIYTLGYGP